MTDCRFTDVGQAMMLYDTNHAIISGNFVQDAYEHGMMYATHAVDFKDPDWPRAGLSLFSDEWRLHHMSEVPRKKKLGQRAGIWLTGPSVQMPHAGVHNDARAGGIYAPVYMVLSDTPLEFGRQASAVALAHPAAFGQAVPQP